MLQKRPKSHHCVVVQVVCGWVEFSGGPCFLGFGRVKGLMQGVGWFGRYDRLVSDAGLGLSDA